MSPIRGEGGWWGVEGKFTGFQFWDPPSRILLGHFQGTVNKSLESSAQAQSIGTLFEQIGLRGGSGHVQKSEAHVLGCRPRGESSR